MALLARDRIESKTFLDFLNSGFKIPPKCWKLLFALLRVADMRFIAERCHRPLEGTCKAASMVMVGFEKSLNGFNHEEGVLL